MRISLVILFCLLIVVVNSATTKTTSRRVVTTAKRATTKAPARKSVYAYLRSVRGKQSCASGSCPFWERHGRSFLSVRCYQQQYQECTCLHRMCFSSCMFSREVCNQEMVSCLQQICPRCLPTSAQAMCGVYNSLAHQVANALSTFACYPCCPNLNGAAGNNTITLPLISTTPPSANGVPTAGPNSGTGSVGAPNGAAPNGGNRPPNAVVGSVNGVNRPVNGANAAVNGGNRPVNGANAAVNGGNRPANGANAPVNGGNRPVNGANAPVNGANRPVNGANAAVNGGNRPANAVNAAVNGGNRPANAVNAAVNGGNRPANSVNAAVNGGNRPANAVAGVVNGGNRPANAVAGAVNGANRPANANQGNINKVPSVASSGNGVPVNNNNGVSLNQRLQKTKSPVQRVVTTRRSVTVRTQKPQTKKQSY